MAARIITIWENEMDDTIDDKLKQFIDKKYPDSQINILSGLRQRHIEDIYETLKDSYAIVIQPNMLEEVQVKELVKGISHSVWINFHSNTNNLSVRFIDFYSSNAYADLKEIKKYCIGLKDAHNEQTLVKIVKCIDCSFYGFAGEHYELRYGGSYAEDCIAVRIK